MNRVTIVLIGSMTLNVFLVGAAAGIYIAGARIAPSTSLKLRPAPNIWVAAEALPPPDRLRFRAMLRDRAATLQPQLQAVHGARMEASALISAPNFDTSAISAAFERARLGEATVRSEFDRALISYLAGMPQAERAALAEAMVRAAPGNVRAAVKASDAAAANGAEPLKAAPPN